MAWRVLASPRRSPTAAEEVEGLAVAWQGLVILVAELEHIPGDPEGVGLAQAVADGAEEVEGLAVALQGLVHLVAELEHIPGGLEGVGFQPIIFDTQRQSFLQPVQPLIPGAEVVIKPVARFGGQPRQQFALALHARPGGCGAQVIQFQGYLRSRAEVIHIVPVE